MDSPAVRSQLWADRVALALADLLTLLVAEAAAGELPAAAGAATPPDTPIRYREALDRLVPLLEEGRGITSAGAGLPAETARFAIGAATSLIFDEFRAGRETELETILPELLFALTMPYLGVEAAEAAMRKAQS